MGVRAVETITASFMLDSLDDSCRVVPADGVDHAARTLLAFDLDADADHRLHPLPTASVETSKALPRTRDPTRTTDGKRTRSQP